MNRKDFLFLISAMVYSIMNLNLFTEENRNEINPIPTREIPNTKDKIPILGFGTWKVFDVEVNETNLKKLSEVWHTFITHGGRLVDSSPMYGNSENFIGHLFEKYNREDIFFATKVWTEGKKEGLKQIEHSFQKMNVTNMNLFQVHNLLDLKTQLNTLRDLKEKGKIKYIGVTHYLPSYFSKMEEIIKKEKLDFIQIPYSISLRDAEKRILPLAKNKGIAVLINRPFEGGDLFSKFLKKPIDSKLSEMNIHSWAELFIRFLTANTNLTCILFASSKPHHVAENMNAAKKPLLEKQDLSKAYNIFLENL